MAIQQTCITWLKCVERLLVMVPAFEENMEKKVTDPACGRKIWGHLIEEMNSKPIKPVVKS